jgi:hypothetical protein
MGRERRLAEAGDFRSSDVGRTTDAADCELSGSHCGGSLVAALGPAKAFLVALECRPRGRLLHS